MRRPALTWDCVDCVLLFSFFSFRRRYTVKIRSLKISSTKLTSPLRQDSVWQETHFLSEKRLNQRTKSENMEMQFAWFSAAKAPSVFCCFALVEIRGLFKALVSNNACSALDPSLNSLLKMAWAFCSRSFGGVSSISKASWMTAWRIGSVKVGPSPEPSNALATDPAKSKKTRRHMEGMFDSTTCFLNIPMVQHLSKSMYIYILLYHSHVVQCIWCPKNASTGFAGWSEVEAVADAYHILCRWYGHLCLLYSARKGSRIWVSTLQLCWSTSSSSIGKAAFQRLLPGLWAAASRQRCHSLFDCRFAF